MHTIALPTDNTSTVSGVGHTSAPKTSSTHGHTNALPTDNTSTVGGVVHTSAPKTASTHVRTDNTRMDSDLVHTSSSKIASTAQEDAWLFSEPTSRSQTITIPVKHKKQYSVLRVFPIEALLKPCAPKFEPKSELKTELILKADASTRSDQFITTTSSAAQSHTTTPPAAQSRTTTSAAPQSHTTTSSTAAQSHTTTSTAAQSHSSTLAPSAQRVCDQLETRLKTVLSDAAYQQTLLLRTAELNRIATNVLKSVFTPASNGNNEVHGNVDNEVHGTELVYFQFCFDAVLMACILCFHVGIFTFPILAFPVLSPYHHRIYYPRIYLLFIAGLLTQWFIHGDHVFRLLHGTILVSVRSRVVTP